METKWIGIAHLYKGCQVDISQTEYGQIEIASRRLKYAELVGMNAHALFIQTNLRQHNDGKLWLKSELVKPILRKLDQVTISDMADCLTSAGINTDDYLREFVGWMEGRIGYPLNQSTRMINWLRGHSFDCDNLLESSQAIDLSTLK